MLKNRCVERMKRKAFLQGCALRLGGVFVAIIVGYGLWYFGGEQRAAELVDSCRRLQAFYTASETFRCAAVTPRFRRQVEPT